MITSIPDDYWSRADPPLRSGTSAIDLELLRDGMCGGPGDVTNAPQREGGDA